MTAPKPNPDNDLHKGAFEDEGRESTVHHDETNSSMRGQIGHRNLDECIEGLDSDYPEPGQNPEHS